MGNYRGYPSWTFRQHFSNFSQSVSASVNQFHFWKWKKHKKFTPIFNSEIQPRYRIDQPRKYNEEKENHGNHHWLKCECYCDCSRDCTDNCCCRCMKNSFCCLMGFIFTVLKYFLLFCIYFLVTCVIICCPPLWILLFCSSGSRGILRCAIWRNLLGLAGE